MIITVTMNPAIDKTIDIGSFVHGGLNRIQNIERDAGGKGINVSKTIHHLGGTSLATGFLAGTAGDMIEQALKEYGISTDFIRVDGETRTNTKVVENNGTVTELNEPGPYVGPEHVEELIQKLEFYASPDTIVVLAGSIPKSVDKTIYRTITEKMHAKGAAVLLDADGELFVHALKASPDIIKPNRVELEEYFRLQNDVSAPDYAQEPSVSGKKSTFEASSCENICASRENLINMGQKLLDTGISTIVISMGGDGALFLNRNQIINKDIIGDTSTAQTESASGNFGTDKEFLHKNNVTILKSDALPVKTHSTVGAGDAMVAALAYGWEQKLPFAECAALAMAASAGAVTTIGTKPPTRSIVDELLGLVKLTRCN